MNEPTLIQGRMIGATDLEQVRQLLAAHPDWSRRRLSQQLAVLWNWRNPAGQLKDMAARTLLLKLEHRGWIALPPRRHAPSNRMRAKRMPTLSVLVPESPVQEDLGRLLPLDIREVSASAGSLGRALFESLLICWKPSSRWAASLVVATRPPTGGGWAGPRAVPSIPMPQPMPTDGSVTSTQKPSRQVRRAQARRCPAQAEPRLSPAQAAQGLTEEIMATAAAKAGALALTQAELTNAEIQTWQIQTWRMDLQARLATIHQHPEENLGHIEEALAQASQEILRVWAQRAAQTKANATL
ncbi:MAG: hypothetical protein ABSH34_37915 [Verrucomicrobiota bacterium]